MIGAGKVGAALTMLLAALVIVAVAFGPGDLDPIAAFTGLVSESDVRAHAIAWDLRLPRALLCALLGAALAMGGVIAQALFRNPMADPGVLGVSSGAAAAAVLGFSFGLDAVGQWMIPSLAALGAGGALALLLFLSRKSDPVVVLLTGVALGAFASAAIALVLALQAAQWDTGIKIVHWLMGSFEGRGWPHLIAAAPPIMLASMTALWLARDLDALQLGDETAASLGVPVAQSQRIALIVVAVLVGTATAIPGVIGFVGLVVPHICRHLVGPGHRRLLPTAALAGGLLLLAVDTCGRTLLPSNPPPGVLTSILGAPVFVWLLQRRGRAS